MWGIQTLENLCSGRLGKTCPWCKAESRARRCEATVVTCIAPLVMYCHIHAFCQERVLCVTYWHFAMRPGRDWEHCLWNTRREIILMDVGIIKPHKSNASNRSDSHDGTQFGNKNQPLVSREPSLLLGNSLRSASRSPLGGMGGGGFKLWHGSGSGYEMFSCAHKQRHCL